MSPPWLSGYRMRMWDDSKAARECGDVADELGVAILFAGVSFIAWITAEG